MLLRQAGDAAQRVHHHAHALALLPEHQHLRLGLDDGLGGQQVLAQLGRLVVAAARGPAVAAHGAIGECRSHGGAAHGHGQEERRSHLLGKVKRAAVGDAATTSAATMNTLASRRRATSLRGMPKLPLASARHIGLVD